MPRTTIFAILWHFENTPSTLLYYDISHGMYSTVQYCTVLAVLYCTLYCTHALMHSCTVPAPSPQIGLGPPKGYTIAYSSTTRYPGTGYPPGYRATGTVPGTRRVLDKKIRLRIQKDPPQNPIRFNTKRVSNWKKSYIILRLNT